MSAQVTRLSRLSQLVTSADAGLDAAWLKVAGAMAVALIVTVAWLGVTVLHAISSDEIHRDAVWGQLSATGVAADAAGRLYVSYFREVYEVEPDAGSAQLLAGRAQDPQRVEPAPDGEPAVGASLRPGPVGAGADGQVFFADQLSGTVRAVVDGALRTVGRAGEVGGLTVDGAGHLYFSDRLADRVFRVDLRSGAVTPVAGTGQAGYSGDGGPAKDAALSVPRGLAVDGTGHLYIADTGNQRIRSVDLAKGTIRTVAGDGHRGLAGDGGPATRGKLADPAGVAAEASGALDIADTGNHRVRRVSPGGQISTLAGGGEAGSDNPGESVGAAAAHLDQPIAITALPGGAVYVVDDFQLRRIDRGAVSFAAPAGDPR